MRSRALSLLLAFAFTPAAALATGAAVLALAPGDAPPCLEISLESLSQGLHEVDIVVVGAVRTENGSGMAHIEPEVYLKGAASAGPISPVYPAVDSRPPCELARLEDGERVIAFLTADRGGIEWPTAGRVYWLTDGRATGGGSRADAVVTEDGLVAQVRSITGQYVVPAADSSEGAGIDWGSTVLPIGAVLLVVFGIGLVLMRTWHRIDPS